MDERWSVMPRQRTRAGGFEDGGYAGNVWTFEWTRRRNRRIAGLKMSHHRVQPAVRLGPGFQESANVSILGADAGSTGNPRLRHASNPPASGRTRVIPKR